MRVKQPLRNCCFAATAVILRQRANKRTAQTDYIQSILIVFWFYGAMVCWFYLVRVVHSGAQLVGRCWLTVSSELEVRVGLDGDKP